MIGYIYKLTSPKTDIIYIGSTVQKLSVRLSKHKHDYKRYLNKKYNYVSSFQVVKYDDAKIELIEQFEYDNRKDLLNLEGMYIIRNNLKQKVAGGRKNILKLMQI